MCKECKAIDDNPDPHYLRLLSIRPEDIKDHAIYKAVGCPRCNNTGFRGRIAVFEMMEMTTHVRELAFSRATASALRKAALASGMKSLLMDGRIKVFKGTSTPQEIAQVTQAEGLVMDES